MLQHLDRFWEKVEKGPGREQKEPIVPFPGKFHNGLFKLCHEDAYKKQTAGIKPPLTLKPVNTGAFCHTIGGKHNLEKTQKKETDSFFSDKTEGQKKYEVKQGNYNNIPGLGIDQLYAA